MITVEQLQNFQGKGVLLKCGNRLIDSWIIHDGRVKNYEDIGHTNNFRDVDYQVFPLLHSLDKIDKVVVHEGKTLLELINENKPTQFVREIRFDEDDLYSHENWPGEDNFFYSHGNNPTNWPHWIVQLLYKYHFDVHNLIPRGLAIEKS